MRFGLLILGVTGFLMMNTYHDGKYITVMKTWKKYYQMAFIGFLGLSMYLFIKKHPSHSKSLFVHANDIIKYMPIDKEAGDFLSPLIDMTTKSSYFSQQMYPQTGGGMEMTAQQKRLLNSGKVDVTGNGKATKRSVSETKKKYVASQQGWKCNRCQKQLTAWYEVDHKVRLEYGGSNEVSNLVALCRECHGEKTTMENL
jgi:hypothetical protein